MMMESSFCCGSPVGPTVRWVVSITRGGSSVSRRGTEYTSRPVKSGAAAAGRRWNLKKKKVVSKISSRINDLL